jgi:hypothetical protein
VKQEFKQKAWDSGELGKGSIDQFSMVVGLRVEVETA